MKLHLTAGKPIFKLQSLKFLSTFRDYIRSTNADTFPTHASGPPSTLRGVASDWFVPPGGSPVTAGGRADPTRQNIFINISSIKKSLSLSERYILKKWWFRQISSKCFEMISEREKVMWKWEKNDVRKGKWEKNDVRKGKWEKKEKMISFNKIYFYENKSLVGNNFFFAFTNTQNAWKLFLIAFNQKFKFRWKWLLLKITA